MRTDDELREAIATGERAITAHRRGAREAERVAEGLARRAQLERAVASEHRAQILNEQREVRSAHWELTTGHRAERHTDCTRDRCIICEGAITHCLRCGGVEGALLPTCPGRQLTMDEHDANYKHYCDGTGPFEELHTNRRTASLERRQALAKRGEIKCDRCPPHRGRTARTPRRTRTSRR
jgi:hypothetical protein